MMSSRLSPCLVFFFLSASWLSLAFWLPCDFQSQLIEFHKNTYCDFDLNSITPDNFWTQFISRNRSSKTKKRIKEDTLGPSQPGFSHLQNTRFAFWVAFMEYGIVEVGVFFFFEGLLPFRESNICLHICLRTWAKRMDRTSRRSGAVPRAESIPHGCPEKTVIWKNLPFPFLWLLSLFLLFNLE